MIANEFFIGIDLTDTCGSSWNEKLKRFNFKGYKNRIVVTVKINCFDFFSRSMLRRWLVNTFSVSKELHPKLNFLINYFHSMKALQRASIFYIVSIYSVFRLKKGWTLMFKEWRFQFKFFIITFYQVIRLLLQHHSKKIFLKAATDF